MVNKHFMRAIIGLIVGQIVSPAAGISLNLTNELGARISPYLHGIMFEDISHSGDGGIYSQLLQNNGFQGDNPGLTGWKAVNKNARISQDSSNPLTSAITSTLKITVPSGATGRTGVWNLAYGGFSTVDGAFNCTFYVKGTFQGHMRVELADPNTNANHGSATVKVKSNSDTFSKVNVQVVPSSGAHGNSTWKLTFDAASVAGNSVNIGYPTLFPNTWQGRPNGLNIQLADTLYNLQPKFLRFPGGNNMEGATEDNRWKWNETIGKLIDRPGRQGTWGYPNTDGLGLMEYFDWCETMNMTPVLAVWDGLALNSGGNTPITGPALQPYIEEALAELEFVLGDQNTKGGALRASYGHADPYNLQYVEIGNEDNLSGGCQSYPERLTRFHRAIKKAYPSLTVIASTANQTCLPNPVPKDLMLDYHDYNTPEGLVQGYHYFDNFDRANPILVGEFSRWEVTWTNLKSACSEAIFMLGWEKNAGVVKMGAYAPTLARLGQESWTPNLVTFDPNMVLLPTSYHVMTIMSTHTGTDIVKVDSDTKPGPLYWSANSKGSTKMLKMANFQKDSVTVSVSVPGKKKGKFSSISGAPDDANTPQNPNKVPLRTSHVTADGNGMFQIKLGGYGVGALVCE